LITKGQPVQGYQLAVLASLTEAVMKKNELTQDTLSTFLALESLAFVDIRKVPGKVDEKALCDAVVGFLNKALSPEFMKHTNKKEKALFDGLTERLSYFHKDSLVDLVDLHHVVTQMIHLVQCDVKNKVNYEYLNNIKQYVNTFAFHTSKQQQVRGSRKSDDFKLMAWQIKQFLEHTLSRMDTQTYRAFHPYAKDKIKAIRSFIDTQCTDEALDRLLEANPDASLNEFTKMGLEFILSMNTTWGKGVREGKTSSLADFCALKNRLNTFFNTVPESSIEQKYLDRLDTIMRNLKKRQQTGLFKDPELYQRKVQKLGEYIDEIKALIQSKKENKISDIESEINLIKMRVENDPDIYTSTSRFFKSDKNVTTVKEMQQAADEFTNKGSSKR
jgi:hypothetical protein